ncbi:MAG TPA: DUF2177 family protein [Chloroflexota bacterium]|nr:DUF2177 family protein [Chloroflexota bacterium]
MAGPLLTYGVTLLLFLVIDGTWLGAIAGGLYRGQLGTLLAERFNLAAAGVFYLLYPVGLSVFAVSPGLAETGGFPLRALLLGALLGLTAYGTYDLTNLAVVRGWPLSITLIDLAWGTALSAVVAALAVVILRALS